jgi:hypothetical protein
MAYSLPDSFIFDKPTPKGVCLFCGCETKADFPCPSGSTPRIAAVCTKCNDTLRPDATEIAEKTIQMYLRVGGCGNCDSEECPLIEIGKSVSH